MHSINQSELVANCALLLRGAMNTRKNQLLLRARRYEDPSPIHEEIKRIDEFISQVRLIEEHFATGTGLTCFYCRELEAEHWHEGFALCGRCFVTLRGTKDVS